MKINRVLVCGGREYTNTKVVWDTLDRIFKRNGEFMLIEGGASGADRLARAWALKEMHPVATVEAQWTKIGNGAGILRNTWMLMLQPQMCIAFPGGSGTANMLEQAMDAKVPCFLVDDEGNVTKASTYE
jgi:hypothetical protein